MFDLEEISRRLQELEARIANMERKGVVHSADYEAGLVRVQYGVATESEAPLLTAPLPWITARAGGDRTWWAPDIGEQVIVRSPGGDMTQGVVYPALYSSEHPAPSSDPNDHTTVYQDGTTITYNRASHVLTLNVMGDVVANVQGNIDAVVGGNMDVETGGHVNAVANTISLDGAGGGGVKGMVQGDCMCAFTGAPHPQISATVKGSK